MANQLKGLYAIWLREFKVFQREKSRVVSAVASPILWILFFGMGLGASVSLQGYTYQQFIFPGILAQSILFSSVFYGTYIIWDRKLDFLKEVLVAPLNRSTVFLGKVLGGITDTAIQLTILLFIGFFLNVPLTPLKIIESVILGVLFAIAMVSIGLAIGSFFESMEGFQLIITFLLFPLFFLSGALYPIENLPSWLTILNRLNPMTYAVDGLRNVILGTSNFSLALDVLVLSSFTLVAFLFGVWAFKRMKL
jgi:ABC-2 type transport system permease protein